MSAVVPFVLVCLALLASTGSGFSFPGPDPKTGYLRPGDVCKHWDTVKSASGKEEYVAKTVGKCPPKYACEWFKLGEYKCSSTLKKLQLSETCWDVDATPQRKASLKALNCAPNTACLYYSAKIYKCGKLPKTGCYQLAASLLIGYDAQVYDAATGQPCDKVPRGKYAPCQCKDANINFGNSTAMLG